MELREWAMRIFSADCLEEKLLSPPAGLKELTDHQPGEAVAWRRPPRPAGLAIEDRNRRPKFPSPKALHQKEMRVRCLHAFANHELMALEMMAWALLAFPQAPRPFRLGLAHILMDEQRHFSLYCDRLRNMGFQFGDLPVNDHFWRVAEAIQDPLDWVCTMHLTFEQANLDHAPFYQKVFSEVEDHDSARLMQVIFEDEKQHVKFGGHWLEQYKPEGADSFRVFEQHCTAFNTPGRARGPNFQDQARREAGLSEDFISAMRSWRP